MATESDRVDAAFAAAPRAEFLPEGARERSEVDGPIEIGWGQTNSQPRTVAAMLRLLDVQPGHRVLDVGCGSGWTTALLAQLAGPTGSVVGVEVIPELADLGRANLAAADAPGARIERAREGGLGWPDEAPYDRVLVSAGADELPTPLVTQVADGGRMVVPVAGTMLRVDVGANGVEVSEHGPYRFVPLV